mmetsp:Transcript_24547/g.28240  ORF Transcript_24547/g.28240 Transcript_24547/m.28240 type:complete len:135 (-) Transcript_24547:128-532(-)
MDSSLKKRQKSIQNFHYRHFNSFDYRKETAAENKLTQSCLPSPTEVNSQVFISAPASPKINNLLSVRMNSISCNNKFVSISKKGTIRFKLGHRSEMPQSPGYSKDSSIVSPSKDYINRLDKLVNTETPKKSFGI